VFRVAGCANGCSRPYAAELALVGQAPGKYALYAGGDAEGTRLAVAIREKVTVDELPGLFEALVAVWVERGLPGEALGDFAHRLGPEALQMPLRLGLGGGDA
jgi:sulfite reductase beta subunit-like hemoprotein